MADKSSGSAKAAGTVLISKQVSSTRATHVFVLRPKPLRTSPAPPIRLTAGFEPAVRLVATFEIPDEGGS